MTRMARRITFLALLGAALGGTLACGPPTGPAADAAAAAPTPFRPDPDVPRIVLDMIAAHGGYETWRDAPSVHFRERWTSPGGEAGPPTEVTVEQGARRAYLEIPGTDSRVGWDGERAWSVAWNQPAPPRFMALLNYYFLDLPWLTVDPGVSLAVEGTRRLFDDPTEYVTVMMTFDDAVGDTPDDWYRLYIHPETKRLAATGYVVTYRALLPEGVASTPEHILVFDETTTVGGLEVPTSFTIRRLDGSMYASCSIDDWDFSRPFDAAKVAMPEGAVVDLSQP